MQLIYLEGKYINQYNSITNGYNIENTIEEVLSGRKIIIKKNIDAQYLKNLISNNGLNANYSTKKKIQDIKLPSCIGIYFELKKEGYILNFPQPNIYYQLLLNDILIKPDTTYYVKDEYIQEGYFINGKPKKKSDGSIQYPMLVTPKGKQFIIEKLELKRDNY
jgi:hypothetical protein